MSDEEAREFDLRITIDNLTEWGYGIRHVSGSEYDIYKPSSYLGYFKLDNGGNTEDVRRINDLVEKYGAKNIWVDDIDKEVDGKIVPFSYDDSTFEASLAMFEMEEISNGGFAGVHSMSLRGIPAKLVQVDLSGYSSTYDSQKELLADIYTFEGLNVIEDEVYDYYDEPDSIIKFTQYDSNGTYYNGDYSLEHGPTMCEDDDAVCVDGRLSNYNDIAVETFWDFDMSNEDQFAYDDPEGLVSVYHRKGKDWYIGMGIETECHIIKYASDNHQHEDEDEISIEEEEVHVFFAHDSLDIRDKLVSAVSGFVEYVEVKGGIYNMFQHGGNDDDGEYLSKLIEKVFDETGDSAMGALDSVDWEHGNVDQKISSGIERWLRSTIDERGLIMGRYRHLNMLREIVEREGKELIMSHQYGDEDGLELYAIKYGKEEYHFTMHELLDSTPEKFYVHCSNSLTKRLIEVKSRTDLVSNARMVFVSFEDSTDSGNCSSGTEAFCSRHGIDTKTTGGIRGDVLLGMDYSNFTRRVVVAALARKKREAERVEEPVAIERLYKVTYLSCDGKIQESRIVMATTNSKAKYKCFKDFVYDGDMVENVGEQFPMFLRRHISTRLSEGQPTKTQEEIEAEDMQKAQVRANAWNASHPAGSLVWFQRDGADHAEVAKTKSEAIVSSSTTLTIFIDGVSGSYILDDRFIVPYFELDGPVVLRA